MVRFWKTLRFRLAVWNAVVVLLTALVTLFGLRQGVGWAILNEMDQILLEDIDEVSLALQQLPADQFEVLTDELARKATGHRQHGWFVQLLRPDGHIVWSSRAGETDSVAATRLGQEPQTIGGERIIERTVPDNAEGVSTVRVGSELAFLRADMQRIDRLVLWTVSIVFVTAPLIGYWLAGRATRHLGAIIQTASRLRPDHLDERLAIQGTGDELDQLAHTVNRLLDRIGEYLQQNRDFLANSAHELRTPLAAIRSSIEVALSGNRSHEEYQDLLIDVLNRSATLETLVNQLLLISESEGERLRGDPAPVAFDEIVRQSADMFAGVAESRNISLETHIADKISIRGRAHLLRQIPNNLIDNAIKYTPEGGRVTVELRLTPDGSSARLSVKDTGIGIDAADQPHIFDRFFRSDRSRTRLVRASGTGLGLSICQAVAASHGGTICCRSEVHHGSEFIVELPVAKSRNVSRTGLTQDASDHVSITQQGVNDGR